MMQNFTGGKRCTAEKDEIGSMIMQESCATWIVGKSFCLLHWNVSCWWVQPFPSDCENLDKESDETLSAARALRLGFALPHILGGQANHRMSSVKSESIGYI